MATEFYIKQGDTFPDIEVQVTDAAGELLPITGATVRFHMRQLGATALVVDAAGTVSDAPNSKVKYSWVAADTLTYGDYRAEFKLTLTGGDILRVPNDGDIVVHVVRAVNA